MRLARDFVLYNLVAAGSAAVDWVVFLALGALGAGHLPGQVGARMAGGLFSFFANKRSMEREPGGRVLVQGRRFLLLYVVSLALSVGLLYVQVDLLGRPLYWAKLVADGTCFLVNFAVMRGYVFRATKGLTHRIRSVMGGFRKAA